MFYGITLDNLKRLQKMLVDLKKNGGLETYDTHIHPIEVMGARDFETIGQNKSNSIQDYLIPSLQEKLGHNIISRALTLLAFKLSPSGVKKSICQLYKNTSLDYLLGEMDINSIDKAVILPIEPIASTSVVAKEFMHPRLILMGSIDVNNCPNVKEAMTNLMENFSVKGIKLHPNLQNFYPHPASNKNYNSTQVLHEIYSFVLKKKLFITMHGGYTNVIALTKGEAVKKTYAAIHNFCDKNGRSLLFDQYSLPIIISHLGCYNTRPDWSRLLGMQKRYDNIYFDTAGIGPSILYRAIKILGSERIVFGSDAFYNKIGWSIFFCHNAISRLPLPEKQRMQVLGNILGFNFLKFLQKIQC